MRARTIIFSCSIVAVLAGVLWLVLGRSAAETSTARSDEPSATQRRRALIDRKLAARADGEIDLSPTAASGQVTRSSDGAPVPGAVVLLTPKSYEQGARSNEGESPEPIYVRTDAGGGWSLAGIRPGRYTLSASAGGFLSDQNGDVRLVSGRDNGGLDLVLQAGGYPLTGAVTDVMGGPVEGALVSVVRLDDGNLMRFDRAPWAAITDADGRYTLQLPSGSFTADAWHPDYVREQDTVQVDESPRTLSFELVPAATIEGVVVARADETPVAGAVVVAQGGELGNTAGMAFDLAGVGQHRVVADEQGRFRMRGLPTGVFELSAVAPGYGTKSSAQVAVGIAETRDDVVVYVEPAHTISGFVVPRGTDGEEGIEGVWVGAVSFQPPGLFAARKPSEADGYFEIHGVQPGNYMVAAIGEEALPNFTGTSAQVSDADVTDVLVELDPGTTIRGRVSPPQEADVHLAIDTENMGMSGMMSAMANAFVRTRSARDGTFVLEPVAPGTIKIVAEGVDGSGGEQRIEVGEDGLQDLVIELEPRASVSGRVVDADGNPVTDARVSVTAVEGVDGFSFSLSIKDNPMFGGGTPTRQDGTFTVKGLQEGRYEVAVRPKTGATLAWAQPSDDEATGDPIEIEVTGEGVDGLELRVETRDGVIEGRVVDDSGVGIPDAWVTAQKQGEVAAYFQQVMRARGGGRSKGKSLDAEEPPAKPAEQSKDGAKQDLENPAVGAMYAEPPVLTDERGYFEIRNLRSGKYMVTAEANRGGSRARALDVAPGSDVTLSVEPLAGIEGKVTLDGKSVTQFTLSLDGPTPRTKSIHSDAGKYHADRLDPGSYEVDVEADEGVGSGTIEVRADQTSTLDIELDDYGVIKGKVVEQGSGEPLAGLTVMVRPEDGDVSLSSAMGMMMGGGPRTSGEGVFEVGKIRPGKGHLLVLDRDATSGGVIARAPYEIEAGDTVDLGVIEGLARDLVPPSERPNLEPAPPTPERGR